MALAGFRPARWPAWWLGGLAFIGIELLAHLLLQLRGRPSFYNGRNRISDESPHAETMQRLSEPWPNCLERRVKQDKRRA